MCFISSIDGSWQDSDLVCALADNDRHLGHLIKRGKWHAYDATRPDELSHAFKYLGAFTELAAAKQAVELAVWHTAGTTGASRYIQ